MQNKRFSDSTVEDLFALFINVLVSFGHSDPQCDDEMPLLAIGDRFSTDAAFFEVGCYVLVRLDTWLFLKRPHLRERIMRAFAGEFIRLFSAALQIRNVAQLLQERMKTFAAMGHSMPDIDSWHNPLMQLLLMTECKEKPESYTFGKGPIVIGDAFEHLAIQTHVVGWVMGLLPELINMMEFGTDVIRRNSRER